MAHSESPWRSTFNTKKERGVRNSNGFICFLPKPYHYTGQDERYEKDLEEDKANALLIAASPDLLSAAEQAIDYIDEAHGEWACVSKEHIPERLWPLKFAQEELREAVYKAHGVVC